MTSGRKKNLQMTVDAGKNIEMPFEQKKLK
jgi:hypothetical protein